MTRLFSSLSHYLRDGEHSRDRQLDDANKNSNGSLHCLPDGITESEAEQFLSQRNSLLNAAWELLEDPEWKPAYEKSSVRVLSQKSRHRASGKAWRLETVVNLPAVRMFEEVWDRVDKQTEWNSDIVLSEVVARLSDDVTILHNATGDTAGGLVKARDFVTLCVRGSRSGVPFTGGAAIETGLVPHFKRFVRGENYPGCIACLPITAYSSKLVWIMDSDIKGWIPTSVVDQAMTSAVYKLGVSIQNLASKIVVTEERTIPIDDNKVPDSDHDQE